MERLSRDEALRRDLIAKGRAQLPRFAARRNAAVLLHHLSALCAE
jgi:hypothetical protein